MAGKHQRLTHPKVAKTMLNAPCLIYGHKHSTIVQWSEHMPCILAAIEPFLLPPPAEVAD